MKEFTNIAFLTVKVGLRGAAERGHGAAGRAAGRQQGGGERRSLLGGGTDTPLLLPVPCREPATWCPRTSPSLPSPCSAASLRMSLSRSCPGCAWCFQLPARAGCLLHGSASLLLGCATEPVPGCWRDAAQPGRTAAGVGGVEGGCLRAGGRGVPGAPSLLGPAAASLCGFLSLLLSVPGGSHFPLGWEQSLPLPLRTAASARTLPQAGSEPAAPC